jgi:acetoin utilization protein AcuB
VDDPTAGSSRSRREEEPVIARDVMTPDPVTVSPEATVAEAWDLLRELDVRHLPVVQDFSLVGILSDRDLGHLDVARMLSDEGAEALRRDLAMPVVKMMTLDVMWVTPDTELSEIVRILLESKVGAVPVVHPDTRALIGIVSYIDVLRVVHDLLGEEEPDE